MVFGVSRNEGSRVCWEGLELSLSLLAASFSFYGCVDFRPPPLSLSLSFLDQTLSFGLSVAPDLLLLRLSSVISSSTQVPIGDERSDVAMQLSAELIDLNKYNATAFEHIQRASVRPSCSLSLYLVRDGEEEDRERQRGRKRVSDREEDLIRSSQSSQSAKGSKGQSRTADRDQADAPEVVVFKRSKSRTITRSITHDHGHDC